MRSGELAVGGVGDGKELVVGAFKVALMAIVEGCFWFEI